MFRRRHGYGKNRVSLVSRTRVPAALWKLEAKQVYYRIRPQNKYINVTLPRHKYRMST